MACGKCGGYNFCHCDLLKMQEELRILRDKEELLELKIEKRKRYVSVNDPHSA